MDYVRQYKSFTNSHYFTEGLRMSAGILIPAFAFNFFDQLSLGILMSFGALCVSITDNPGPVHHRRNGMSACIVAIFIMSILANMANVSAVLTGILLVVASFFFSMFGVFGARPGSIGVSALVVFILHIDNSVQPQLPILPHALLLTAGGLWYMSFSMALYTFRPFKLAQQALGEWVQTIALYLQTRATLYKKEVDYPGTFQTLFQQQAIIQEKQNVLREILLKTRTIVKETTPTGRLLLITFIEMSDLFEKIITAYSRYADLHKEFDETGFLEEINKIIAAAATELEDMGIAIKSGTQVVHNPALETDIQNIKSQFEEIMSEKTNPDNLDIYISLRRIIQNLEDIVTQLVRLQQYFLHGVTPKRVNQMTSNTDIDKFLSSQPILWKELVANLTFKSDVFRHSVRVTLAMLTGFFVGIAFNIGHGYWILLTILVIMKPAYSLSKKRNRDRLIGTVAGAFIGFLILQLIQNNVPLLIIMVVLMVANFSFMRTNYLVSVMLMTPYILIFFYILHPQNFTALLKDRVMDTAIGSVIAFAASIFLFPLWEKYKIRPVMIASLEKVRDYFNTITAGLGEEISKEKHRLARKDALVALANISDAFNRMLNEPKYQQTQTEKLQRFVVLIHSMVSYIATMSHYMKIEKPLDPNHPLRLASAGIIKQLQNSIDHLEKEQVVEAGDGLENPMLQLQNISDELLQKRMDELEKGDVDTPTRGELYELKSIAQQFKLINRSATDLEKISAELQLAE